MQAQHYHAECGGEVADTGLHSRGKSLWRCSSCGFVGFPNKYVSIDEPPDEISPVRIEIDGVMVCFLHLLDTRDRRVRFKIVERD
jgi:hypothetical protein